MLDAVNALRQSKGAAQLDFNAELIAACAAHSRDMAVQNRPWHFGSDGSSPLVRAQRVGYAGKLLGETTTKKPGAMGEKTTGGEARRNPR